MNKSELFSYLTKNVSSYTVGQMVINLLVLFAVMSVAVPDFWNGNINYKNNPLDAQIPNQADSEVADINFNLPVLYIYSHDIEKLCGVFHRALLFVDNYSRSNMIL